MSACCDEEPAASGETASIRRRAGALSQRAEDELPPDTPGRDALTRSLGGIADVTRTLDSIRAAPDSSESVAAARRARRQMVDVVGSLDAALVEFRDSLEAEGAGDAVAVVEAGLGDLRASERRITTVFDELIDAVR